MMNDEKSGIHVGTSGWHYEHWQNVFYPEELSGRDRLSYYAGRMNTVEINNSFYQLPAPETLARWRKSVPRHFLFAVKANRYITHMKKLNDTQKALSAFLQRIDSLEESLGPILFQLPPRWGFNPVRFQAFLKLLPADYRYAFELPDRSWQNPEAYELMKKFSVAFCIYDLDGFLTPKTITTEFIYIRLHGPDAPYEGNYSQSILSGWAGAFSSWSNQGKEIFCYFDNDQAGYAPQNALSLYRMVTKNQPEKKPSVDI